LLSSFFLFLLCFGSFFCPFGSRSSTDGCITIGFGEIQ
jgi:hypothetical protein